MATFKKTLTWLRRNRVSTGEVIGPRPITKGDLPVRLISDNPVEMEMIVEEYRVMASTVKTPAARRDWLAMADFLEAQLLLLRQDVRNAEYRIQQMRDLLEEPV